MACHTVEAVLAGWVREVEVVEAENIPKKGNLDHRLTSTGQRNGGRISRLLAYVFSPYTQIWRLTII